MRKTRRAVVAPVVVLIFATGLAIPAEATPGSFSYSLECDDVTIVVPVDGAKIAKYVQPEFSLFEPGGQASLFVEVASCDHLNDQPIAGPIEIGEGVLLLDQLDPPPACQQHGICSDLHFYDWWEWYDSAAVTSGFAQVGLVSGDPDHGSSTHVEGITYSQQSRGPVVTASGTVARGYSPYSLTVTTASPPVPVFDEGDQGTGTTNWRIGRHGLVSLRFLTLGETDRLGPGTLTVPPGTPLADVIGGTSFTGPADIRHFTTTGTATLYG